ncbi:MAG: hypothetical protein PHO08_08575 [Methylococcales bacterium]|nr:hypothetical protein [Methylococcales bacterium]
MKNSECVALQHDEAVKISEAAKLMDCTVDSLLKEAASSKRLIYVALSPHSAKLAAIPTHTKPRQGSYITDDCYIVALLPNYARLLSEKGSFNLSKYYAGFEPPLDWHYWVLDEPQIISLDDVNIPSHEVVRKEEINKNQESENTKAEPLKDAGAVSNNKKNVKGEADRLRTIHFIDWVERTNYDGKQTHYYLQDELRKDNPKLWGRNEQTFNKWLQASEATQAKKLLDRLKLEARQAV